MTYVFSLLNTTDSKFKGQKQTRVTHLLLGAKSSSVFFFAHWQQVLSLLSLFEMVFRQFYTFQLWLMENTNANLNRTGTSEKADDVSSSSRWAPLR